jgi:hypothetical protein
MSSTPETRRARGLRLHDLIGLVVGYGMAALLARSFWPRTSPLLAFQTLAFLLEFCWLGLAMSGPIVLLLDRRIGISSPLRPKRPDRPGRLIRSGESIQPPVGRSHAISTIPQPDSNPYTKAELAWMIIGGYWIGLTMFVVPALSIDTPWALVGLLQIVTALILWVIVPRRASPAARSNSWTHYAALGLLWSWPFAWIFLILLSRSL